MKERFWAARRHFKAWWKTGAEINPGDPPADPRGLAGAASLKIVAYAAFYGGFLALMDFMHVRGKPGRFVTARF